MLTFHANRACLRSPLMFITLVMAAMWLGSCSKKTPQQSAIQGLAEDLAGKKLKLADYIVAKPAAVVSSQAPIELEFSRPMVPPHLVDGIVAEGAFQFTPALEGEARWLSQSLVRFTPKTAMPPGIAYKLIFHGRTAFGAGVDVDDYSTEFRVVPQELLTLDGDFAPVSGQVNMAQLELVLRFAQKADLAKLKADLKLKSGMSSLDFTLAPQGEGQEVKLTSAPLERTGVQRTVSLSLGGDWSATGKGQERDFVLAAKGSFVVVSNGEVPDAKSAFRTWSVRFSDPLPGDQDWSGFVQVEPAVGVKVLVQGRSLKIQGDFMPGTEYRLTMRAGLPSAYG